MEVSSKKKRYIIVWDGLDSCIEYTANDKWMYCGQFSSERYIEECPNFTAAKRTLLRYFTDKASYYNSQAKKLRTLKKGEVKL